MSASTWAENFKWDSEDQKKSFLAAAFWLKQKGLDINTFPIRPLDAFFMQKDHESHEWHVELLGSQIAGLQKEISALQNDIRSLRSQNSKLKEIIDTTFNTADLNQKNVEKVLLMVKELNGRFPATT